MLATSGGGFVVPNATSYDFAFVDAVHVSVGEVLTPVAPLAGDGLLGALGAGSGAAVVKDHSGPRVTSVPLPRESTCQ